jgi:hypothetical protein
MVTKKRLKSGSARNKPAPKKAPVKKAKANPPLRLRGSEPAIPSNLPHDPEALVRIVERAWPESKSDDVVRLFEALHDALSLQPADPDQVKPSHERGVQQLDLLDMLRRTFTAHDLLFLRRRITYHIASSSTLPPVRVDHDRVQAAMISLLEYLATHAPRGSRINVQLDEIKLRSGPGVQVSFAGWDDSLKDVDKMTFMNRMYEAHTPTGAALVSCREIVSSQGGQMWADLPEPLRPVYYMVLPSSEIAAHAQAAPQKMFKYDISISNYANIRKRFGIKKSLMLVGQIEMYVRALVRHPIDIVLAVREKGVITTIYESPSGSAPSVASRISQRLGTEEFHIGKRVVDLNFRYKLSQLPASSMQERR